jgi:hypothetical protein
MSSSLSSSSSVRATLGKACLASAAFAATLVSGGGEARAQEGIGVVDYGPTVLVVANVTQAPPLIADTVYVIMQRRPPLIWPILGFVLGAGGVALGLGFALPNASSQETDAGTKKALGTSLAIEGAVNIGLGIWALTLPRARVVAADDRHLYPSWNVAPWVAKDQAGRFATGAALTVGHF